MFILLKQSKTMNPTILTTLFFMFIGIKEISCTEVVCAANKNWMPAASYPLNFRQQVIETMYPDVKVVVDRRDLTVSQQIKDRGSFEPDNIRTFARFVKEGDTILNIGSHIGLQSMVYGRIVGPKGQLIIFEPYSVSHNIMLKNVYLNGLENRTTVHKVAASNIQTMGTMLIYYFNTGGSGIYTDDTLHNAVPGASYQQKTQINLADNLIPQNVQINFALIDVESNEIQTLEGLKKTILRSPNIFIICEWAGFSRNFNTQEEYQERAEALLKWFENNEISIYRLDRKNYYEVPNSCQKQKLIKMSVMETLALGKHISQINIPIDLLFTTKQIDPNELQ